ncbi:zinc finger protein 845-like [Trichoplusia ni]|uniref:Zinc finger protein 845-like n=1 Tax=Trichoplusia ni TaxID=7111 RepID=A0A7E5VH46_TRINI|nr:zinc finger protein 845-like [Trichoplusia ni]
MGEVQVCRICLNMDVKMFDLQSEPLGTYFTSIMIESKPLITSKLPLFACFECAALVKKFYLFREKCIQSQTILCGLLDESGKITPEQIKASNRKCLLVISNVTNISLQEDTNDSEKLEHFVEVGIKKEDDDEVVHGPDGDHSSDDECKDEIKETSHENVEVEVKLDEQMESVELAPQQETSKNLPSKKPHLPKVREQRKTKTIKRAVAKKTRKASSKDNVCEEDSKDMEDITVVTLTMEEQLEEMNKRKQSSNYLNCPYQCHQCYKGFVNTHAWKHHVTKHSPSAGDLECEICKYRFKTKRTLQRHALNHGKKYVCKLCPYNSSNITTVKQHQGSHKGITHKCNYCDEVFAVRTTYMSHMRIKHPSENICGYCGYSFVSKQGLVVHKNMVHKDIVKSDDNEEGPYCADCDVKFISTEAFKRHMVMSVKHTSSMDSINGCRVCGLRFSEAEQLRLHRRREHPKKQAPHYRRAAASWPAPCTHCSEVIPSAREYWKHFRRAHPDENYPVQKKCVCDICGKRLMCNALLEMHKRTHFGDRPYKCSLCDKACFTAFDLRVHQQKHSDARPFPCTVCPKAFKRKEAMDRHLKIHSGDNPYKCEICGVAFSKSCTRTLHVRTAHTREPAPHRPRRGKQH